jgi:RNA polymerase sigma-70 factor (ECF subfamily)
VVERDAVPDFERTVLPHFDAAYNLARWLTRGKEDAEDVVQEAYLRALRFFPGFRGGDARAWLLRIVRNTCYTWRQSNWKLRDAEEFNEEHFQPDARIPTPEQVSLRNDTSTLVRKALENLPVKYREVIVLRELEELSYKEIAEVAGMPVGTVMSTLSRARERLRLILADLAGGDAAANETRRRAGRPGGPVSDTSLMKTLLAEGAG